MKVPDTLNDDYFRRTKAEKKKKTEGAEIFQESGKVSINSNREWSTRLICVYAGVQSVSAKEG